MSLDNDFGENFNPRSHKGSDALTFWALLTARLISIHAPTRGATIKSLMPQLQVTDFNPRSHKGSDSNISQKNLFIQ